MAEERSAEAGLATRMESASPRLPPKQSPTFVFSPLVNSSSQFFLDTLVLDQIKNSYILILIVGRVRSN
jgi:hypothetical protein